MAPALMNKHGTCPIVMKSGVKNIIRSTMDAIENTICYRTNHINRQMDRSNTNSPVNEIIQRTTRQVK